jgi:hypothetical protein
MDIKMTFVDGTTMVVCSDTGEVLSVHDEMGQLHDYEFPEVSGIWYDDEKCTISLDEVVDYKHTDFHLVSGMFMDNGQVIEESEIVSLEILGIKAWSLEYEWDGEHNNVYCKSCDTEYKVEIDLPSYVSHWCSFCGNDEVLVREPKEDISKIQSELAKGMQKAIRREAPWIIGEDE